MSSPIDLTAGDDSDVEVTGPPVIDLTSDRPRRPLPQKTKRPRDRIRAKGVPMDGGKQRKRHDVRGATARATQKKQRGQNDGLTYAKQTADAAFQAGKFDEAGRAFVKLAAALEEEGDDLGAARELGNAAACALEQGKALPADHLCTTALRLNPDSASLLLRRARARRAMGKAESAKRDAQRAFDKATPLDKSRTNFLRDVQVFGIDTRTLDPWASIRVERLNGSKPCRALGVRVARDGEEVTPQMARTAFRKCAVKYHPDKLQQKGISGAEADDAKEKFRVCREAADLFADAALARQFHYNYAVIGTRLTDNISEEVLDYDSDRDVHSIRDRASWLESSRRLPVKALGGAAPPPPARRRRR